MQCSVCITSLREVSDPCGWPCSCGVAQGRPRLGALSRPGLSCPVSKDSQLELIQQCYVSPFSGQVGEPGGCGKTLGMVQAGAEQVRPWLFWGWALPSCQAANSPELLPNTNTAGVRGRWQLILLQAPGPVGPSLTPARCLLSGWKVSTPGWET